MTSKKPTQSKRTNLPRSSDYTKQFHKDWKNLTHSGRYDMNALKKVMMLLIVNEAPLPKEYLDHELRGEWTDHRECHVGGDFLLIYQLGEEKDSHILFVRTGTHAELFE